MPKIKKIELPKSVTIGQQLHNAAVDLLPREMVGDNLVRWVMKYDGLIGSFFEEDEFIDMFGRGWYDKDNEVESLFFCYLGLSGMQAKLPFYFATLFHISRMKQVSKMVQDNILEIKLGRNLRRSALWLAEHLKGENKEERAVEILEKMSETSHRYYSLQLDKADFWWEIWRKEVHALKLEAENLDKIWKQGYDQSKRGELLLASIKFWAAATSQSKLRISMSSEGVNFKSMQLPTPLGENEIPSHILIPLILRNVSYYPWDNDYVEKIYEDFRDMLSDWLRAERENLIAPLVKITLDQLMIKYSEKDPFDDFIVGQHAATFALRQLVRENQLPNGMFTPWLHKWKLTLEEMPFMFTPIPLPKPKIKEDRLLSAVRLADSVIKDNITDNMLPTENWNDFVQRTFENKWVMQVGIMAGEANKSSIQNTIWSSDEFIDYVHSVILRLNGIGYSLKMPAKTRLQTLLYKATHGESVDNAW